MGKGVYDTNSPHFKGTFLTIYAVNQKYPAGGVDGDWCLINGWAHYWDADRGTWCVNSQRDTYWDELFSGVKFNTENIMKKYEYLLFDLSKKANTSDVQASLEELKKEIGDRTVVEGNVTNLPDEEDITSGINESGTDVLSLKDRVYNPLSFSGKGYKILRKNIKPVLLAVTKIIVGSIPTVDGAIVFTINGVEVSVDMVTTTMTSTDLVAQKIAEKLTATMTEYEVSKDASTITLTRKFGGSVTPSVFSASTTGIVCTVTDSTKKELRNILTPIMMNQPNTIYEIRYDFDLNGETIEMKEGCTLKFNGGIIGNGELVCNKTVIIASKNQIFKDSLSLSGKIKNSMLTPKWFGAKAEIGTDDSFSINKALESCFKLGSTMLFDAEYHIKNTLIVKCNCVFVSSASITCEKEGIIAYLITQSHTTQRNVKIIGKGVNDGICGIKIGGSYDMFYRGYYTNLISPEVSLCEYGLAISTFQNNIYSPKITNCKDALIAAETQNAGWINLNRFFGGTFQGIRYSVFLGDNRNLSFLPSNFSDSYAKQGLNISFFGTQIIGKTTLCNVGPVSFINTSHEWITNQSSEDKVAVEILEKCSSISFLSSSFDKYDIAIQDLYETIGGISLKDVIFSRIPYCGVYTTDDRTFVDILSYATENTCFNNGVPVHSGLRAYVEASPNFNIKGKNYRNSGILQYGKYTYVFPNTSITKNGVLKIYNIKRGMFLADGSENKSITGTVKNNNMFFCDSTEDLSDIIPGICVAVYASGTVRANPLISKVDYKNKIIYLDAYIGTINDVTLSFNITSCYETASIKKEDTNEINGKIICDVEKRFLGFFDGANWRRFDGNLLQTPLHGTYSQLSGLMGVVTGTRVFFEDYNVSAYKTEKGWICDDGEYVFTRRKGGTEFRPTNISEGFEYYDTTLKKKILWNGTAWVNMDGTELEVSTSNEQGAENPS